MIYIKRDKYEKQLESFVKSNDKTLLHFFGIAGSGKTQLIKNSEILKEHKSIFIDYTQYENLSAEGLIQKLLFHFFTLNEKNLFNQAVTNRVNSEVYHTKYNKKHILKVSGKLDVEGDLIIGDVHNYGEKDAKSKQEKKLEILTEEFCNLFVSKNEYYLIILDRLENINSEVNSINWITFQLLDRVENVKIITLSRKKKSIKIQVERTQKFEVKSLEHGEATDLLIKHNITDEEHIKFLIIVSRLHPLSLILAIRATINSKLIDKINLKIWSKLSQELIVEFLVKEILDNENEPEFKNALLKLPLHRFFIADTISAITDIPQEKIPDILLHFSEYGFIEEVNGGYKFHDLLFELINKYIIEYYGINEYKKLHLEIYKKYQKEITPIGYELIYKVEPLYHIFKASPSKAQPYFEKIIKPALDRKDRVLSSIIINEIDFNILPDSNEKGWYLLRLGGFYREFDDYEKALEIFNASLCYSNGDNCLLASIKNNIGWVFLFHNPKENIDKAIKAFEESNELCKANNLVSIVGMNHNNLGIAFERKGKYETAIQYYKDSLEITESKKTYNPIVAAKSYRNIGLIYEEKNDLVSALNFYEKALEKYSESEDSQSIGETLFFISKIFFNNNMIQKAIETCLASQRFLRDKRYGHYLSESHLLIVESLIRINDLKSLPSALYNFLTSSVFVNWYYHQLTVSRFIQLLKLITVNIHLDYSKNLVELINRSWLEDDYLKQIPLPAFLNENVLPNLVKIDCWYTFGAKRYHLLASNCKVRNWKSLVLTMKKDIEAKTSLCKKCEKRLLKN